MFVMMHCYLMPSHPDLFCIFARVLCCDAQVRAMLKLVYTHIHTCSIGCMRASLTH